MALTRAQGAICSLLAGARRGYWAGGTALNTSAGGRRRSRDLDRFHDTEAELNAAWEHDRKVLRRHGYAVKVERQLPGFVRALVRRGQGEATRMEWCRDAAYRFFPLVKHRQYGRMLSPFDLATNKLLTMAGRLEVRDWVDLLLCHRRVQPLGLLAYAACGKDPGFSPLQLIEYAARCTRYTQVELDSLAFRGPAPTLADLHRDWHRAVEQARELLAILPPEHAGKCVRQKRGLFRGTPAALRRALAAGELTFHSGRLDAVIAVPTGLLVNPVPLAYPKS